MLWVRWNSNLRARLFLKEHKNITFLTKKESWHFSRRFRIRNKCIRVRLFTVLRSYSFLKKKATLKQQFYSPECTKYCVTEDDARWIGMCDNPLNKGKGLRTDSLLGREECKSPFGSYELKIPKDNNMECTADGFIKNTNCKDLDVSSNTRYLFVAKNRSVVIWSRTLWGRADWDSRRGCWREKLYSNPLTPPFSLSQKKCSGCCCNIFTFL